MKHKWLLTGMGALVVLVLIGGFFLAKSAPVAATPTRSTSRPSAGG
jgi:hypothetical protein